MEKRFLSPNSFDSSFRLTKSASFSELTTSKKVIIEQCFQSGAHGNLVKQYSCEEFHDQKSNESHLRVSQTFKSDKQEQTNVWNTTVPSHTLFNNSNWLQNHDKPMYLKSSSLSMEDPPNKKEATAKSILSSPKLIFDSKAFDRKTKFATFNNIAPPNFESTSDSEFVFKKPLPVLKDIIKRESKSKDIRNGNGKDLSDETKNESEVEKSEPNLDTSELKKRLRSLVKVEPSKKKSTHLRWSYVFSILVSMTVIYLAFLLKDADTSSRLCNPRFQTDEVAEKLKNFLYNQDLAVNVLTRFFTEVNNKSDFNVVALVGGIGVGKSYTSEIIKSAMRDTSKTLDYFPSLYRKEDQAYTSLSACRCNLIRLENLKTDDIVDATEFASNLRKLADNYCVLVLALINPQETDDYLRKTLDLDVSATMIGKRFEEAGLRPVIVKYNRMNNDALVKCIEDAADYANVVLSDEDVEYVMRDLLAGDSGCKGAYAKVQLVGKSVKP